MTSLTAGDMPGRQMLRQELPRVQALKHARAEHDAATKPEGAITIKEFERQLGIIDKSLRSLPATAQVSSCHPSREEGLHATPERHFALSSQQAA